MNPSGFDTTLRDYYHAYIADMRVETWLPHPALRKSIVSYMFASQTGFRGDGVFFTPVSGAAVEIGIHPRNTTAIFDIGSRLIKTQSYLVGIRDNKIPIRMTMVVPDGNHEGIIIKFTESGILDFIDFPLNSIANLIISLEDLWGNDWKLLQDRIDDTSRPQEVPPLLDHFFLHLQDTMRENRRVENRESRAFMDSLTCRPVRLTVEDLSSAMGIPYRTFHRRFEKTLGIDPKQYLKVLRFQRACKFLQIKNRLSWTEIAIGSGYYDQAHLIRDFKYFMKLPPGKLFSCSNGKFMFNNPIYFDVPGTKIPGI